MKFFWSVIFLILSSTCTLAQETPKVEVFGGYSYLRADGEGGPGSNLNGWQTSVTGNINNYLGLTAEFSNHYGNQTITRSQLIAIGVPVSVSSSDTDPNPSYRFDLNATTYLFGPRFSYRKNDKITPFAHVLVGGVRAKASGTVLGIEADVADTSFGAAVGGGMDVKLSDKLALRLIQADYLLTRSGGSTANNVRVSTGLVFRLGQQ